MGEAFRAAEATTLRHLRVLADQLASDWPTVAGDEPAADTAADRSAFSAAALELLATEPDAERGRQLGRLAADALVRLAHQYDGAALGRVLRPDPAADRVTWTVACYQIGDLTPSALRDFSEPVAAVSTVAECSDASHVAAELLASTSDGLRWTAVLRTGERLVFQPPPRGMTGPADDSGEVAAASRRWERDLHEWAARDRRGDRPGTGRHAEATPPPPARGAHFRPGPSEAGAPAAGFDVGYTLGQLVAAVRSVESSLATADAERDHTGRRLDAIENRLQRLEAERESPRLLPVPPVPLVHGFTEARVITTAATSPAPAAPAVATTGEDAERPGRATATAAAEMWAAVRLDAATVAHHLLGRLARHLGR